MKKLIGSILISCIFGFANENVVKTSELELFLFKVGFESLLKDVEITKDKSKLNEDEINKINEKIELIMNEIYKNKRVLVDDSNEQKTDENISNKQILQLKREIDFLKKEMLNIKKSIKKVDELNEEIEEKKNKKPEEEVIKKDNKSISSKDTKKVRVASDFLAIYSRPITQAKVLEKISRDEILEIGKCQYGWCKLANNRGYIREFLVKKIR
jgi:cupin superfamily acireductone dioxygenase involved in methionine salvage